MDRLLEEREGERSIDVGLIGILNSMNTFRTRLSGRVEIRRWRERSAS